MVVVGNCENCNRMWTWADGERPKLCSSCAEIAALKTLLELAMDILEVDGWDALRGHHAEITDLRELIDKAEGGAK